MKQPTFAAIRAASIAFADFARPRSKYAPDIIEKPLSGYSTGYLAMARLWEAGKRPDLTSRLTSAQLIAAINAINSERLSNRDWPYALTTHGKLLDVEFVARLMIGKHVDPSQQIDKITLYYKPESDGTLSDPTYERPSGQSVRVATEGARIVEVELIGG